MSADTTTLTEPEAWREIAHRIEVGDWDGAGLCRETWRLYHPEGRIARDLFARMWNRMDGHLEAMSGGDECATELDPLGVPDARILAAYLLAYEAEEEEEER